MIPYIHVSGDTGEIMLAVEKGGVYPHSTSRIKVFIWKMYEALWWYMECIWKAYEGISANMMVYEKYIIVYECKMVVNEFFYKKCMKLYYGIWMYMKRRMKCKMSHYDGIWEYIIVYECKIVVNQSIWKVYENYVMV